MTLWMAVVIQVLRRQRDVLQLWLAGLGFAFLATIVVVAQSQDYINASLTERMKNVEWRLDRLETYLMGLVATVLANLLAHIIEIRGRPRQRHEE